MDGAKDSFQKTDITQVFQYNSYRYISQTCLPNELPWVNTNFILLITLQNSYALAQYLQIISLQQSFSFFLFLCELHTHALWPIRMCMLKRNLNTSWPEPAYIRRELQFTQLNSFPNSIFKGRMQFQGLTADKVNVHMGETKGAVIAADGSSADPFMYIPVLKWFSAKPWHTQPCSPGSTGGARRDSGVCGGNKRVKALAASDWRTGGQMGEKSFWTGGQDTENTLLYTAGRRKETWSRIRGMCKDRD